MRVPLWLFVMEKGVPKEKSFTSSSVYAPEAVWVRSCSAPSSCKKASFLLTFFFIKKKKKTNRWSIKCKLLCVNKGGFCSVSGKAACEPNSQECCCSVLPDNLDLQEETWLYCVDNMVAEHNVDWYRITNSLMSDINLFFYGIGGIKLLPVTVPLAPVRTYL